MVNFLLLLWTAREAANDENHRLRDFIADIVLLF